MTVFIRNSSTLFIKLNPVFWALVLAVVLTILGSAQSMASVLISDAPVLEGAVRAYESPPVEREYRVVNSAIKKVNNQWRAETNDVLGRVQRTTYLLKDTIAFRGAQDLLALSIDRNSGYNRVFQCSGLDCGSSNGWANHFLAVKQLYGLDQYQNYSVWERREANNAQVIDVFYLVQRGNRRVYLQHDHIERQSPALLYSLEQIQQRLTTSNSLVVSRVQAGHLGAAVEHASSLLDVLKNNPSWVLRVVGHDYSGATLKARMKASEGLAKKYKDVLMKAGGREDQITAHGVGSLAPGAEAGSRVECVIELAQ